MLTRCTVCEKLKERHFVKFYPSGVRHYKDDNGNRWVGKKCYECTKKDHAKYMKKARKKSRGSKNCEKCNVEFSPKRTNQKYCDSHRRIHKK